MRKNPSNAILIRDHVHDLDRRGMSAGTVVRRRQTLERLAEHAHPIGLLDVTADTIQRFLDLRSIGARTRYSWLSHFHCFYVWAIAEGLTTVDPTARIHRPKLPRLLPRPISDADLTTAVNGAHGTMRSWLLLAAYAGLRCREIAALNASDVITGDRLLLVHGKGNRDRLVPMHPLIDADLRSRGLTRSGPIFRRPRGSQFPAAMVSREIAVYFDGLGIDATAHTLRHWFASRAYQSCQDLRVVQELLGHASITTTTVYTAWSPTTARSAVEGIAELSDDDTGRLDAA